jgi:hypothetical protein
LTRAKDKIYLTFHHFPNTGPSRSGIFIENHSPACCPFFPIIDSFTFSINGLVAHRHGNLLPGAIFMPLNFNNFLSHPRKNKELMQS